MPWNRLDGIDADKAIQVRVLRYMENIARSRKRICRLGRKDSHREE